MDAGVQVLETDQEKHNQLFLLFSTVFDNFHIDIILGKALPNGLIYPLIKQAKGMF
jgi:hypothetical protein